MGFITYKQADSRWGRKNYNGSSTMATAGCGPTACAMIAYGINGKTTPLDTMKYMQNHGYAIRNNGTAWNGIPSCLKAYGLQNVQDVPNMTKCWELMSKGYVGVFLFRGGSRGGITWTTSGHYIAVTDYKVQNGKHYIYTRDSGGRNHTGWYCYETQMRGLIPRIWLGSLPKANPTPKPAPAPAQSTNGKIYTGTFPTKTIKKGSKGDQVVRWQNFLKWMGFSIKADGIFGQITADITKAAQKKFGLTGKDIDGIVGPTTIKKAKAYKKPISSASTSTSASTSKTTSTSTSKSTSVTKTPSTPTRKKMSKIGHARADYDHKAGDSSGKEVCKTGFTYNSSSNSVYNWTYVFRPKDIAKAEKAAVMCEKAIANNNIGYCSSGETKYGKSRAMTKLAKAAKYDLSKINVKCGCSCGDLICLCNHWAGLSTCYIGSGKQLAASLKKNSNFTCYSYKKGMQLYRGDVLITAHSNGKNNHVVMCL